MEIVKVEMLKNPNKKLDEIHSKFLRFFIKFPEEYEIIKERSYFAGGCIRDLANDKDPKDYDLFFFDILEAQKVGKKCLEINGAEQISHIKPFKSEKIHVQESKNKNLNCYVNANLVQVITVGAGLPKDLIQTFDFSINTGYYHPFTKELYIPPEIETKVLKTQPNVLFPVNAMLRLPRFLAEGYTIEYSEIISMAVQIQQRPSLLITSNLVKETMGLSVPLGDAINVNFRPPNVLNDLDPENKIPF